MTPPAGATSTDIVRSESTPSLISEVRRIIQSHRIIFHLIDQQLRTAHRNKILGNLWVLFDPLLMMLVLFFVFSTVRHAPIIFCLYLFPGLLAWDIFNKSISGATGCMRSNRAIIHKFPMALSIFPVAIVLHKTYDWAWGLGAYLLIYLGVAIVYPEPLPITPLVLLLPVWLFFFMLFTLGLCFVVARIGVFFRDMSDIVAILLRVGFFLNPIFITVQDHIPAHLHVAYFMLNPVAGYLIYMRRLLPGGEVILHGFEIPIHGYPIYLVLSSVLVCVLGLWVFKSGERHITKNL